jgi:hypothetical protein
VYLPNPNSRLAWYLESLSQSAGLDTTSMKLIPFATYKMGCTKSSLQALLDLTKPYKRV